MKLYKYLLDKNYRQISFKIKNSPFIGLGIFTTFISTISFMSWFTVILINSLVTTNPSLSNSIFFLMIATLMAHIFLMYKIETKSKSFKAQKQTTIEMTEDFINKPDMLKGFICECIEAAKRGEVGMGMKSQEYYRELIEASIATEGAKWGIEDSAELKKDYNKCRENFHLRLHIFLGEFLSSYSLYKETQDEELASSKKKQVLDEYLQGGINYQADIEERNRANKDLMNNLVKVINNSKQSIDSHTGLDGQMAQTDVRDVKNVEEINHFSQGTIQDSKDRASAYLYHK